MVFNIYHFSIFLSLIFCVSILELVRRQSLKEQYSLLWLFVSFFMVVISFKNDLLEQLARVLDVHYAPAVLFLFGLIFSIALNLHLTVIISKYSSQHVRTVQELAILKQRVEELESIFPRNEENK